MTAHLNFGLIGFGRMGQGHAANLAGRVRGAKLFAVAEPVQEPVSYTHLTLPTKA